MPLRRYALLLPALIALLAAAILLASGGPQHSARAAAVTATATPSSNQQSNDWGNSSSDSNNNDSEGSIGSDGSSDGTDGSSVLSGVGDTENVDPGNRLESARVILNNVNDGQEEYARYCFKDDIQTLDKGDAASFAVLGPNSGDGQTADEVRLDENRDGCVIAGFEANNDLKSYTMAAVESGVVKNRDGQKNVAGSVELDNARGNSSDNRTAGPNLVKVSYSKNLNEAKFTFDSNLERGTGNADDFGFYSKAGGYHTASSVVSTWNRGVTVKFDNNDQVDTGHRWFVTDGAVQDHDGNDSVLGTTNGSTDAPDLTSVSRDSSDTEYDYKFDQNVGDLTASDFVLYSNDGTQIQATSINTDGDEVHATFDSDIQDYPKDIVLAGVVPSNATDSSDEDTSNASDNGTLPTIGVDAIGSSNLTRAGRTTGPDLVSVSKNADDERITLRFDEKLDDDTDNVDASGIYLVTSDNRMLHADSVLSIKGKKVYVKANKTDIRSLKGIVIEGGTVEDKQGNTNPLTSDIWGSGDTSNGSSSSLYSHGANSAT